MVAFDAVATPERDVAGDGRRADVRQREGESLVGAQLERRRRRRVLELRCPQRPRRDRKHRDPGRKDSRKAQAGYCKAEHEWYRENRSWWEPLRQRAQFARTG